MTDQTIIITGASRGLGAAATRIAASLGARLVLNARSEAALAERVAEIQAQGGQAIAVPGDISHPEVIDRLVSQAIHHFGQIDALINNAGMLEPVAPLAGSDPQEWRMNLEVNLLGPVWLVQACLPHLRGRSGRVINVSSGAALHPVPGWSAYCAAKSALHMFTQSLSIEEPSIIALSLRPGVVDTAMQADIRRLDETGMPADEHARYVSLHEEGRLLPPELPGRALAILAMYTPREWSGSFLTWDEERVQNLVSRSGSST
jgi:NAD(P)-dependent dehydrogenase (short-subunit alcohol dehydrogenase family)